MKAIARPFSMLLFSLMILPLSAQEKQVPFFPEQDVVTIDRNYAKKMSFFTQYENFKEARLFLTPGGEYALEIYYTVNDSLYKDRQVMSYQEKEAYLDEMARQYAEKFFEEKSASGIPITVSSLSEIQVLNQKGRSVMLVMNTLAGLGYYGIALPITFQVEDEKALVGLYMLTSAASFYIPYRITENKDVTLAQASLNFYGISRGAMHGMFLGELLSKYPTFEDYYTYDPNDPTDYWNSPEYRRAEDQYQSAQDRRSSVLFGLGTLGSISGGIAGYNLAKRWGYDGGSTSIFQMWGDVGTISGLLFADVFDFYDNRELDAVFGTAMATSFMGMAGGKFFGDSRNYTLGDAIVYRSTIALSTLPLLTIVDYFQPDDFTTYTVAGLAGIAAGGYLGWRSTLNRDFSTNDGVFVALGELAGGLLGLGIGYLIAPDFESEILLTSATLGALGGYGIMYGTLNRNALTLSSNVHLDFHLNPMGLLMNQVTNRPFSPQLAGMYTIGSLSMRF